ncbi:hypothetical protein K474DRAFT_1608847 [Panus rudis PR-1116 ss-1]|nr:hypothetical protein K474DRAFT_1608847 [Panus rudis PR-1116 ss-1]
MSTSSSSSSSHRQFLAVPPAPFRKLSQRLSGRTKNDIDEFLSSDLEMSFASTMSIHSPPLEPIATTPEDEYPDYVPMDISPVPPRVQQAPLKDEPKPKPKMLGRPRAFTSAARLFGTDMSNSVPDLNSTMSSFAKSGTGTGGSSNKKLQRAALPIEWMASAGFDRSNDSNENIFAQPQEIPASPAASDAMDIDTSFAHAPSSSAPQAPAPLSAAATITGFNIETTRVSVPCGPFSAAPTVTTFKNPFLDSMLSGTSPGAGDISTSIDESPIQPFHKKRRSQSPEGEPLQLGRHIHDDPSSPGLFASPSMSKLDRIASAAVLGGGNHGKKPILSGLGAPLALNANNKRPRRPVVSAMIPPATTSEVNSAHPDSGNGKEKPNMARHILPPVRRAFSAMLPPQMTDHSLLESEESSFDQSADMSSPAQAYAKRQQVKTIRRCDGTDDFRPLTGASALVQRDSEVVKRGLRRSEERIERVVERDTPRSKYLNSLGLGGFGDNEAHGKILPCHRVKEDGLMRITPKTLNDLLDGVYSSQIVDYTIIDCRFDYEYNGGHIPGAININTTAGVEEFLLGNAVSKPVPSTSGDPMKKNVLVFHCEFSAKRAPTFAKHLRSKDRALNNHLYPKIHYPEVYILEGGYCAYYKASSTRCQPQGYVQMDDPKYAASRREDLDHFRKAKFGRTKSYAYGDGKMSLTAQLQQQQPKRNSAPSNGGPGNGQLFAAANAARGRRTNGLLQTLCEDSSGVGGHDAGSDEETDIGDSPCPPPTKASKYQIKKIGRAPLMRAETYGPSTSRMPLGSLGY